MEINQTNYGNKSWIVIIFNHPKIILIKILNLFIYLLTMVNKNNNNKQIFIKRNRCKPVCQLLKNTSNKVTWTEE